MPGHSILDRCHLLISCPGWQRKKANNSSVLHVASGQALHPDSWPRTLRSIGWRQAGRDALPEPGTDQASLTSWYPLNGSRWNRLENIIESVHLERIKRIFLVGRRKNNPRPVWNSIHSLRQLKTVQLGHFNIQESNIRLQLGQAGKRLQQIVESYILVGQTLLPTPKAALTAFSNPLSWYTPYRSLQYINTLPRYSDCVICYRITGTLGRSPNRGFKIILIKQHEGEKNSVRLTARKLNHF